MGAFLSPDSKSEQNLNYSPQAVSDNGVAIRAPNANFGQRLTNSGNASYKLGAHAQLTFNQGADIGQLSALITKNMNDALAASVARAASNDATKISLGRSVTDRTGKQITDAPADDAQTKTNHTIIAAGILGLGLLAVLLGGKN